MYTIYLDNDDLDGAMVLKTKKIKILKSFSFIRRPSGRYNNYSQCHNIFRNHKNSIIVMGVDGILLSLPRMWGPANTTSSLTLLCGIIIFLWRNTVSKLHECLMWSSNCPRSLGFCININSAAFKMLVAPRGVFASYLGQAASGYGFDRVSWQWMREPVNFHDPSTKKQIFLPRQRLTSVLRIHPHF